MQAVRKEFEVSERIDKDCVLKVTTCDRFDAEEQMSYTTYGIILEDSVGAALLRYEDISTNRPLVERFVRICAEKDAAAIHIAELLEDYLD